MKRLFLRRIVVLSMTAILLSPVIWFLALMSWQSGAPRGRFTARYDLWRGHYEVLSYGLPVQWDPEYRNVLRVRYGINVHPSIGCVVFPLQKQYMDAYNEVSTSAANRKFGHDVFKEAEVVARSSWLKEHPAELQHVSHSE